MILANEISALSKKELVIHSLFLTLYFVMMELGLGSSFDDVDKILIRINFISVPTVFYIHTFGLIPAFLKPKKWIKYITSVIVLALIIEFIRTSITLLFQDDISFFSPIDFIRTLTNNDLTGPFFIGLIASFGYRFTKDWVINLTEIERLKSDKYASDLAFLKSQIDPHFLFNTLNSLYSTALEEKSDATAEGIAKLGTLMRYNLHDSQADAIPLTKEIDYIRKFIDLQKLRLTDTNTIQFKCDIDPEDQELILIAPMLFIPLIENAFKYGVNPSKNSEINIHLYQKENRLTLEIENDIVKQNTDHEFGGVGLENLTKRLELLYPNRSELIQKNEQGRFHIALKIDTGDD